MDEAKQIVVSINEVRIPVVAEVDGFVRVQNTKLETSKKVLVVLYYKRPEKVSDANLAKWIKYKNISRLKTEILSKLDAEAIIHYESGLCTLLPKGIMYVEKNISLDLLF
jgi:5-methylcytosine-specific restriction endonuclease McrBC GTP-binding regulatory subunit McrB